MAYDVAGRASSCASAARVCSDHSVAGLDNYDGGYYINAYSYTFYTATCQRYFYWHYLAFRLHRSREVRISVPKAILSQSHNAATINSKEIIATTTYDFTRRTR